jgi:DNA sulfur modification protein DndB
LLCKQKKDHITSDEEKLAIDFWNEVAKNIPDWQLVKDKQASAAEMRRDYIHSHALALHALGRLGAALIAAEPKRWKDRLKKLSTVDWSRTNTQLWERRATQAGKVSKSHASVLLTTAVLKRKLELPISADEQRVESMLRRKAV